MPTVSKPNWMSIITGAGPEEHGVLDNNWVVGTEWEPLTGNDTYFPSVFEAIKEQSNKVQTAFYNDWPGFEDLFPHGLVDFQYLASQDPDTDNVTAMVISDVILPDKAQFIFLHFDNVDDAGHHYGWGSPEYYDAVVDVDTCVGKLVDALEATGILSQTLVILTADHGGENFTHGFTDTLCMYTPLFFMGPSVKQNFSIPCPTLGYNCYQAGAKNVRSLDLPATALFALGLQQPDYWIGQPLTSIYADKATPKPEQIVIL